jgi:hypothetical protein
MSQRRLRWIAGLGAISLPVAAWASIAFVRAGWWSSL